MKDAKGHGSEAHNGAAHQAGVEQATNTQRPVDMAKVDSFVAGAQGIINDYYARSFANSPHMVPPTLSIPNPDAGRYLRVVRTDRGADGKPLEHSGSVHSFVDKTTGDVFKAAGWKGPAKGARGNVHDEHNGLRRMTHFGPEYNK